MYEPFLLSRVLLRFNAPATTEDTHTNLSAITLTPDGHLWTGSDELLTIERLAPVAPGVFGEHRIFPAADLLDLFNTEGELDIEGMEYSNGYLWLTGSHSTKRKKAKGKKPRKDLERLATVEHELNRYILGRVPVLNGELLQQYTHPEQPATTLAAACLQKTEASNILIDALRSDAHLGPFLSFPLPSKENGFDIEGMAVRGNRVFLGFRGPVLRGWAIILEIEVEELTPGILTLKGSGAGGNLYCKHFVDLDGLGIRDLCFQNDDLIILSGPTLDTDGAMRIFRLHEATDLTADSVTAQDTKQLEALFDLPFRPRSDRAEGIALFPCLGQPAALLVVYDAPHPERIPAPNQIFADVFWLR